MITRKEFNFNSSDRISNIYGCIWIDENKTEYKGIIQLIHGMAEHILRYENFACFLASKGYVVCGNDHIGHGRSAKNIDDLGYFGEGKYNYVKLIKDIHHVNVMVKNMFPKLPITVIGHSMGSFLGRSFVYRYPEYIKSAVFIGTSGSNPLIATGIKICSIKMDRGKGKERGNFVNKLAFGAYNSRYENKNTDFDWICSDDNVVNEFIEDEKCGFIFTYAGYNDLFSVLKEVSSKEWYKGFDKRIPVLLVSGSEDPVGNFGKGVREVYRKLKKESVDTDIIIYKGMRHEVLNEKNKFKVYSDIEKWICKKMI